MTSSIKITSLTDIGANLSTTSLVPVVNMSGVPETQKANLQIVGNLILNGAGTSFPPAAQTLLAQSVTNAAQPNITSVGTLSALNVSGNVTTGNLVAGNIVGTLTGSATTAGTVTTNAQPNITSVGTLNGLTVSGLTNLGPISNITITGGSAGQVLSTDGAGNLSWVPDATSTYGDSNVTSLLAAFGSNTITTTGLITGDGGGLSNVPYANLSGAPSLGNISGLNIDGDSSNILYGNGIFAAAPNIALTGDGGNLSNIAGANVSGEVSYAAVANSVAAANVSGLGNISTININGSNNSVLYGNGVFANVASLISESLIVDNIVYSNANSWVANYTGSGGQLLVTAQFSAFTASSNTRTYALQKNGVNVATGSFYFSANAVSTHTLLPALSYIDTSGNTSSATWGIVLGSGLVADSGDRGSISITEYTGIANVGNIINVSLDGNASNVLYGNGVFAAAPAGGTYGDSNVTTLLGSFGSNVITTTGVITADGYGLSNVPYANITGTPSLGNIASVNLDGNASNLLSGAGTFVAIPVVPTVGNIATINLDGNSSNVLLGNGVFSSAPAPTSIVNGTSNVVVASSGNVTVGVAGTANIITATSTGANVTGTLDVTGNVTAQGVGTNLVRRANTISGSNTVVQLDNLNAYLGGTPTRLYIGAVSSNMTMAGTSQTMISGSMAVSSWINLPIVTGVGNGFATSGAISSDGDTVVLNITDQGTGSGTWRVTGMIANSAANLYSVSIERLA